MLAQHMLGEVDIRVMDYSYHSSHEEDIRRQFADSLADRDFIFTQTALMSHTSEGDLRARYGQKVVTMANFYFRGLFPDSCYVGDFGHRLDQPTAVHSVVVLDAFRRGLSEEETVGSFQIETFQRLGLLNAWELSMREMERREANNALDVPGAALMEESCRAYPAFHTMNHPSALMLAEYMSRVFRFAGIEYRQVDAARLPDPLAMYDLTPVLDLVAEHRRLPYRTSQAWRLTSAGRQFIGIESYVARCFETYRAAASETLLCHSPSDMVAAMHADPALAYLVDPGAPLPHPSTIPRPTATPRRGAPMLVFSGSPLEASVNASLDEIKLFTHKIHSFMQVADPKIERIVRAMPRLEAPPPEPPPPPPRGVPARATMALCALVGALAGSLLAAWL